jgi:nucleotide-binding universal stress UspA family protein
MTALEPGPQSGRIVVGVDFTQPSDYALALAADLARSGGTSAELTIVHVVAPTMVMADAMGGGALQAPGEREKLEEMLRERLASLCAETSKRAGVRAVPRVLFGEVVAELAHLARDLNADLIVVGARHDRGVAMAWHRSLSARLLRRAPCSVLTARPKEVTPEVKIEPPCAECLEVRRESGGTVEWCARHAVHHVHPHFHHGDPQSYVTGSWTFRS